MAVTLREANRALKRLPEYAKVEAQKVMDATAFQVFNRAQAHAPYRLGGLRRGLRWQSRPRSTRAVVGVDPSAYHWRYVEYGTVTQPAQPFLRPAAEAEHSDHQQRMAAALNRASDTMVRSAGSGLL